MNTQGLDSPGQVFGSSIEASGRLHLLLHSWQKELSVGSIEAGCQEVGPLTGIEVVDRFTVEDHLAIDFGRPQPWDQAR